LIRRRLAPGGSAEFRRGSHRLWQAEEPGRDADVGPVAARGAAELVRPGADGNL